MSKNKVITNKNYDIVVEKKPTKIIVKKNTTMYNLLINFVQLMEVNMMIDIILWKFINMDIWQ